MDVDGCLTIRDKDGKPRIILSANAKVPAIILAGTNRSEIVLEMDGDRACIRARDSSGKDVFVVGAGDEGASLVIFDERVRTAVRTFYDRKTGAVTSWVVDERGVETKRIDLVPPRDGSMQS